MALEQLKHILLASSAVNIAALLAWSLCFMFGREFMYRQHSRWFRISPEQFDAIHYCGLAFYKILILAFNIAPLAALWLAA